jgi:mono/diheme cytochrome c family protein
VWREAVLDADKSEEDAVFVGLRENMHVPAAGSGEPEPKHKYYPRQTPMIAGRTRAKGPYGWHAEASTMVERLQRGLRLHRASWEFDASKPDPKQWRPLLMIDEITDYLQSGLMPPPTLDRPLTDAEKRGKAIFESAEAQCNKCHVQETEYTDRTAYPLRALPLIAGFDVEKNSAFKTPSLFFIGGTSPYYHDGSQATLEDLVKNNGSRMGQTGHLNAEDQAALVAYLRTL